MKEYYSSKRKFIEGASKARVSNREQPRWIERFCVMTHPCLASLPKSPSVNLKVDTCTYSPGCSCLGCCWDDCQEDVTACLTFEQDLASRTCLPQRCFWNVCPICLSHDRSYPRTQPWDSEVVLKPSGLCTCLNPVKARQKFFFFFLRGWDFLPIVIFF